MYFLYVAGLEQVGGYEKMRNQFYGAASHVAYTGQALHGNHSCGFPPWNSFHIFRPANDGTYPWPGMILGLTILAINAWCTDQASYTLILLQSIRNLFYVNGPKGSKKCLAAFIHVK